MSRGFRLISQLTQNFSANDMADIIPLPQRETEFSAGYDIRAAMDGIVPAGGRLLVSTGITAYMPQDSQLELRSRSGLANKYGVIVLNAPATIDADYEGNEIKVILYNTGTADFNFRFGERIAQGVFTRYDVTENDNPANRKRTGGLGHTGM